MTAKDIGTPSFVDSSRAACSKDRAWSCVSTRPPSTGPDVRGNPGVGGQPPGRPPRPAQSLGGAELPPSAGGATGELSAGDDAAAEDDVGAGSDELGAGDEVGADE